MRVLNLGGVALFPPADLHRTSDTSGATGTWLGVGFFTRADSVYVVETTHITVQIHPDLSTT
jgi:hypothetical protein